MATSIVVAIIVMGLFFLIVTAAAFQAGYAKDTKTCPVCGIPKGSAGCPHG